MIKKIWNWLSNSANKIWNFITGKNKIPPGPQLPAADTFLYTTSTETDGKLQVFEGNMPSDVNGVFYVMYPVGTVNSNGLPYTQYNEDGKYNKEYGSPIMNGDGMLLSVSFNGTQNPVIKTRLMKTPCYFADYASRYGTSYYRLFGFSNFGISRMSLLLGARNEPNTAVTPVKFGNANTFLLASYDVGRPFITDPVNLVLQTPVGNNLDWTPGTPEYLPWPFPVVQTTAHPSFDPNTEEVFTVNYTRLSNHHSFVHTPQSLYYLRHNRKKYEQKLLSLCKEMGDEKNSEVVHERLIDFFDNLDYYVGGKEKSISTDETKKQTSVWLMRWKGSKLIEKWILTDQNGQALQIAECMHQTALTKDFIVLTDTAFKFSLDLLVNNPFPENHFIDRFIRKHLAGTMLPYTDCYIVKRAQLTAGGGQVTAYKLSTPIPVETIHYSCNYENPNGKITLYGIHNTAACVAEWIRPYDISKLTGKPADEQLFSLFALGSMDVNRIGKWVLDTNTLQIDNAGSKQYYATGNTNEPDIGPNTWTVGLYTFRDIVSATKTVNQIKYLWYVANGLDQRMLTEFIFDLYQDYPNRIVSTDEIIKLTQQDLPQTLVMLDCNSMQPVSHFQFQKNIYIRSLHFIPRQTPTPGVEYELDGYLFCTLQAGIPQANPGKYRSEYWVFDAAKINEGPVCKLLFDDVQFCFTLHSAWLENASTFNLPYDIDIKQDYDAVISKLVDKRSIQRFFDNYVYPQWYALKNKQV